ncbi:hypothetical protein PABG_05130 [Paracoccidioides brasiliensis Pb03]|nr:hypothetical protein PABG_05130 [Paracoccidioides brasiliensis Pb03]
MSTPSALVSGVELPGMVLGLSCARCRPRLYTLLTSSPRHTVHAGMIGDFSQTELVWQMEDFSLCNCTLTNGNRAEVTRNLYQQYVSAGGPEKITTVSERSKKLHRMFSPDIYRKLPHNLSFLSDITQGAYFLSNQQVAREEIGGVSKLLGENEIYQENTRWLQAGISYSSSFSRRKLEYSTTSASQLGGDNAAKVEEMCACLEEAKSYAANPPYEQAIERDIQSFATGRTEAYRDSQELWVKDMKPAVETILRFVEPYRDPYGVRAEFEGLRLPWRQGYKNGGMGPFEKDLFDPPNYTSLQATDNGKG